MVQVEEKCVSSEEQRSDLFNELLEKSTELVQFSALLELLKVWPTLQAVGNRWAHKVIPSNRPTVNEYDYD